jgi:hypothetical protein
LSSKLNHQCYSSNNNFEQENNYENQNKRQSWRHRRRWRWTNQQQPQPDGRSRPEDQEWRQGWLASRPVIVTLKLGIRMKGEWEVESSPSTLTAEPAM